MGGVWVIHGVARAIEPGRFAFRNLIDIEVFGEWLRATAPCVGLADGLAGRGTALTIDDATRAGAEAALLARQLGHQVSIFVNPGQVVSGRPHAFLMLNALLDGLRASSCVFEERSYPTVTLSDRQVLRRSIKQRLASIPTEEARWNTLSELATAWGVAAIEPPPHFATLGRADLVGLRDAGVDVQNHGWSHGSHAQMTPEASAAEVERGRAWLAGELGVEARYFAVPFGDVLPPAGVETACDMWLLSTLDRPIGGDAATRTFNREELMLPSQAPVAHSPIRRFDPLATIRRWVHM